MRDPIVTVARIVRVVAQAALAERVTFLAASIAFYAVLSIFPLLLVVLVVGSVFIGETFAAEIVRFATALLAPEAAVIIEEAVVEGRGRIGAGLVGVAFLLWAALKLFRGLDLAFSMIYGVGSEPTFVSSLLHALVVLAAMGIGFLVMFIVSAVVRFLPRLAPVSLLAPAVIFVTVSVLFFPMYFVFPGISQPARDVVPGTVFAAAGWTCLAELFGFYAANAGTYALFGFIGGLLLMFTWFYFGSVLVLLGAVINAALAGRYHDVSELEGRDTLVSASEERPLGPPRDGSAERDE